MALPKTVEALLQAVNGPQAIGFSGSRAPDALTGLALKTAAETVLAIGRSPRTPRLGRVGDANGADAIVRRVWDQAGARPARMDVYRRGASHRDRPHAALIERSTRMALDLAGVIRDGGAALLIAGPAKACPYTILPSGVWISGKDSAGTPDTSGTWSTMGVAIGVGVPCLLYLPPGRFAPPTRGMWDWNHLEEGWWWHDGISN